MANEFKIVKLLDSISLNLTNDSILDNVAATAAPTVTDDTNAGYSIRSIWIDTTNDEAYIAVDVTAGAAVWKEMSLDRSEFGLSGLTDNRLVRTDGTEDLQESGITVDDSDNITGVNSIVVDDFAEHGDPGTESGGIDVNGVTYDSRTRINDIGGTKPAQIVIHRHSTSLFAALVGSRSNSDTSAHAVVTNAMELFRILGVGWTGSHYDMFGDIRFMASGSGTIGSTSSPGQIQIRVTPDGSNTPVVAVTVDEDGTVTFAGATSGISHGDLTGTHNLTTDIDHNTITNNHNLTTDIDHNTITNNHNLTTDIDHDQLTNFVANEHIDWTGISAGTIHASNYVDNDTIYTHPNHTGEVTSTGDGAQVVDPTAISNKTNVTAAATDEILIGDASDTGNLKKVTAQSIADLAAVTTDHGALSGLADDDHTQYLNETRHDALAADNPHSVTAAQAGALATANNLSDLASATTARTNLGLDAGGAGDIWVEKAGDTMTGTLNGTIVNVSSEYQIGASTAMVNYTTSTTDDFGAGIGIYASGAPTGTGANTVFGNGAGNITTGFSNVFIGDDAGGVGVTTGARNVGIGRNALLNITSGSDNIAIGASAGNAGSSASSNVLIGTNAGVLLTTGSFNTIVGSSAGNAITSANSAVLYGFGAGNSLTSGVENTFIGSSAGNSNSTGARNVALGASAMQTVTGSDTIALGRWALRSASGNRNVGIGTQAGQNSGGNGVYLGYAAGRLETGTHKLYIDNTDTTTPLIYGEFNNDLLRFNGQVGINLAPSSHLTLPAGTATAGDAPLKFTSGTNLTTPEAGSMEFDGTSLFFTPSTTRRDVILGDTTVTYTPTNVVIDRTYDANATTTAELADVLGTLIADLQALNVIG